MDFYRKPRFWLITGLVMVVLFFVIPPILGVAFRGRFESEIQKAVNAPVKVGSVSINLLPPGASLSAIEIGSVDPDAGDQPLIVISSARANVSLGTLFGGKTHVTRLSISALSLNVHINEKSESSFNRFLNEMPVAERTVELPIDVLSISNLQIHTWAAGGKKNLPAAQIGTTAVASVYASGLVLPAPSSLLGREAWIDVDLRGIALTAPALKDDKAQALSDDSVADGAFVEAITLRLAQAPDTESPLLARDVVVTQPQLARVFTRAGEKPGADRAIAALELAMGGAEAPPARKPGQGEKPSGTGILVNDLKVTGGRIETRGPDADGKLTFWRLENLSVSGQTVAFGPTVKAEGGELLIESDSESSAGPGKLKLIVSKLSGGYPKWSCDTEYLIDGVAGQPFTIQTVLSAKTGVRKGSVAMQFAGPIRNGNLNIDGSLTLSKDFEVTGTVQKQVVKLTRGDPIKTIRIRGTIENPDVQYPDALAGALGKALEKIMLGSPVGVLDTVGGLMGSATGQGVREAAKKLDDATGILKKVPGLNKVPGLDKIPGLDGFLNGSDDSEEK